MLEPGAVIERYVVSALVGSGAMARVYRVEHTHLGSTHALKVVESPGAVERFAREARAQAQLRHPNVVAVTDFVDVAGLPGLVMEFVDGSGLNQLLRRGSLPWNTADRIFTDVCAGVQAAHALNMVHRDGKPANVLVAQVDGRWLAKVADFGIVKVLGEHAEAHQLTRSSSGMGTPGYMAPEQMSDAKHADVRADIFSLGCVLYRMLCGTPPFHGGVRTIYTRAARGQYAPPEQRIPNLPPACAAAIRACLEPDRERRPPTIAALRAMLGDALGEGGGASPAPRSDPSTFTFTVPRSLL